MGLFAKVAIHPSQFPEQVQRELCESLRRRALNHKFLYEGLKQTQKWLELHQACSPARTDPNCIAAYQEAFVAAVNECQLAGPFTLIGLGCGGGQKDSQGLESFRHAGKSVAYVPVDVSVGMVLTARQRALSAFPSLDCTSLVCDLATAQDLPAVLEDLAGTGPRVLTFFGIIPNFEPEVILPRLAALMRREDLLLLSANLAPGADYEAGMRRILPSYDNQPTRDWLLSFLGDIGISLADGELRFDIEQKQQLKRVVAKFRFARDVVIGLATERLEFTAGETLQVFFSYRYTPALLKTRLGQHQFRVEYQWVTDSGEETVLLLRRRIEPEPASH